MHQTLALAKPAAAAGSPVPAAAPPDAKRRGRKRKAPAPAEEEAPGAVAGDGNLRDARGVEVDLVALGRKEDLFGEEIMRRTAGIVSEEGLLEFMNGLDGKWATVRKRRRIVDAAGFGDGLPEGWKLLLALKRKDGKVWIHCRRYLSPSGKQFATCKEVACYILSIVEAEVATKPLLNVKQDENNSLSADMTNSCRQAAGLAEEVNHKMETARCLLDYQGDVVNSCNSPVLSSLECRECNIKFPDKTTCEQHSLTCHSSSKSLYHGESFPSKVSSESLEALPTGPAESKPYPPVPLPLLSSQEMDLKISSETFEVLPHVGSAESGPESLVEELSLSSSETKAEIICEKNNIANGTCSSVVHESSSGMLENAETQLDGDDGGDDSYHIRNNLSNSVTDLHGSEHFDGQINTCDSTFKVLNNDVKNIRKIDADTSDLLDDDSDPKTDILIAPCETANDSTLGTTNEDSAKPIDVRIDESLGSPQNLNSETNVSNAGSVEMDINADVIYSQNVRRSFEQDSIIDDSVETFGGNIEENHMALQNLNYETDTARDIHESSHAEINCDRNDQWSREGDSPAKDTKESLDGNTDENNRSPEHLLGEIDTFSIKDVPMDTHAEIDCDQNDQVSKKGESIDTWVTHYNSSYDNFQSVELNIAPDTAEESSSPDHGCRREDTAVHVPEVATRSVDSLANNTMGGLLRNYSEMNSMSAFDAAYDKSFMIPCTGSIDPSPADTPDIHKFDPINRINAKAGHSVESCDVGYGVRSDCNMINALETTVKVSGVDNISIHNTLKENTDTITQSSNNAGQKVHASFRDQSPSSIGIVNLSGVTYTVEDLSGCKVVGDTKNYHNNCKSNYNSDMSISAVWPPTENEIFTNRATDGLGNPICNQQFYLEENLHPLQGHGPPYNTQTGSNDIIANVAEEQGVAAVNINNYSRKEDGLIIGHGLSGGSSVVNHFVHENSRAQHCAKDGLLPSSSGQGFGIASHTSRIFPCDVQESFICHSRNGSSAIEGVLGCSFSGSDKVPVTDISQISGADIFGSAAGRQPPHWIQPSSYFSTASVVHPQVKHNRHTDQRHGDLMGFEGIRLDDYGPSASGFPANQDSHMKSSQHLAFDYSGNIKNVYSPHVQLDWNTATPQINAREEITIRCIWCCADFSQQGSAIQVQPDSTDFICPNCKANISGQLKF